MLPSRYFIFIPVLIFTFTSEINAQTPDWNQYANSKEKLAAIQQYGIACIKKQQFDDAIKILQTGLQISRQASLDSFTASNLFLIGAAYRYKSKYDSAFYYLQSCQKIADEKKYTNMEAAIKIDYYAIYNRLGKSDSAAAKITQLRAMIPQLDSNSVELAKIEMYSGHEDKHNAKYNEALQHYFKALRIFEYIKDSTNMGNIYVSIANVYVASGQVNMGINYHQQAAEIFTRIGRRYELTNELLNITDMYYTSTDKLDSAEITVKRALDIANELKEQTFQAYAYLHLGHIQKLRGKFSAAIDYFMQSLHICEQAGMELTSISCYKGIGETYMAAHQPLKAKPYLEKHFLLLKKHNNTEEIIEGLLDLSENEFALHNYSKAYEYQKLYAIYKDSAYNKSVSESMAEMEAKYQNEKKEQEIVLLKTESKLKNVELQKQITIKIASFALIGLIAVIGFLIINRYRVIQKAKQSIAIEKIRNNIARDLHDDIGSTITSINVLSKISLEQPDGNAVINSNLKKIKDRSSTIMENMSDIVWAINPAHDTLDKLIMRMKEFAVEMLEPAKINFQFLQEGKLDDIKLSIEQRKDLYLVFKEAVNNAIKYSGAATVDILLQRIGDSLILKIADNGSGFDIIKKYSGNGLKNMQSRANSMGADLSIHSEPAVGTSIRLQIPVI